jgi:NADPH2:quinone reductase
MVLFEAFLGLAGLLVAGLFGFDALSTFSWSVRDLLWGLAAAAPMFAVFLLLFHSPQRATLEIRRRIEDVLLPLLRRCNTFELALLAVAAGVGEETLFRGCVQTGLTLLAGSPAVGLLGAGLLFGVVHWVTPAYGVLAAAIGGYLGVVWLWTGNLLAPIAAHAVYDFSAFLYYLHATRNETGPIEAAARLDQDASCDYKSRPAGPAGDPWGERRRATMKAAYILETGPVENIRYGDLPTPAPSSGQALIRVRAASVNPIDVYIRSGAVPMPIPTPYILGCDLAGVVEAVGPGVAGFKVGDRVWGSNQGLLGRQGTFAEYAVVDEHWLYPLEEGVDFETAAAIALVGITAHLGLVRDARLAAGETVFVSGGSGGVGSAVVQMAKALGARVIATAGGPESAAKVRAFGADAVVDYKTGDLAQAVRDFAPDGINVWWETVREPDLERAVPLTAKRGRIVVMAGRDARPTIPLGAFYTRDCKLIGFAMFNASPDEQRRAAEDIRRWLVDGRLRANIDRTFPLSEAGEAHRLQEENTLGKRGTLRGKIVLKP